jgi:HEAT repeat protein
MRIRFLAACLVVLTALGSTVSGQKAPRPESRRRTAVGLPGSVLVEEATELTNGWARLAEGSAAQAAAIAARLIARSPRDNAALALSVEAEIARAGAVAALDQYERWLNGRSLEEPAVVRRIATATLWQAASGSRDLSARVAALQALRDDGDAHAGDELSRLKARAGGGVTTRTLAATGDDQAVKRLIGELKENKTNEVQAIDALGSSGNTLAISPLLQRLADPRQEVRGAAVGALGRLGDPDLAARIKPMLADHSLYVRAKAADALLRLGDDSGWPMLQELSLDPSPSTRLLAAESMASRPDASWLVLVRQLTEEQDPEIRAGAAHLIAPHEPEIARAVLGTLSMDDNPAIREMAAAAQNTVLPGDLPSLRRLLRSEADMTRVQAAAQVLAITR